MAKKYTTSKTIEYTGALPITINADGNALLDYQIYGNTVYTGTPTPENPIMPEGVGELETTGIHAGLYKLPLTSAGQNVNIYLGEAETTRRIKKSVLTGNETFTKNNNQNTNYLYYIHRGVVLPGSISEPVLCNELPTVSSIPETEIGINTANRFSVMYLNFGADIMNAQLSGNTVAGLKEYLAARYAAGTPVTIWYVLANEETGIANEPLMKLGDYADTIDSTQAAVQIPTFAGTTVVDYDGTLKPPKMYIKYIGSGWIDADCKRYQKSPNLIDESKITNELLGWSTGTTTPDADCRTTDFVAVQPDSRYYTYSFKLNTNSEEPRLIFAFYDNNKRYVEGNIIKIEGGQAGSRRDIRFFSFHVSNYVRCCWYYSNGEPSEIMLNEGTTMLPYEPYSPPWHDTTESIRQNGVWVQQ